MGPLEDRERQLLERLAAEGKATKLYVEDLPVAKSLVSAGLLFLVGENEPYAVITPKGRRLLAILERKPPKPPQTNLSASWISRALVWREAHAQSARSRAGHRSTC